MTSSGQVMLGSSDCGLVLPSVLISLIAAFIVLNLAGRVAETCRQAKLTWLMGDAAAIREEP